MGNMDIGTSNRVVVRSAIGRFISEIENAGNKTVQAMIQEGAEISKSLAPVGRKHDRRTVPLRDSLFTHMESRTQGYWGSISRHALPIEHGARPHTIMGSPALRFFWEREGRMWIPAEAFYGQPGLRDFINHPGNAAQPFLRPAYEIVSRRAMEHLRKNYKRA